MNLLTLKLTIRRLVKSPLVSAINFSGLSLGIACAYLGMAYAWHELSFEKSFTDTERIYRVGVDFMNMGGFAVGPEYLPEYLATHSKVVKSFCRLSVQGQISLQEDSRSVSAILMGCDSSFLDLFDFPVLTRNGKSLLSDPTQAVVSKDFAQKWFHRIDVVGQQIEFPIGDENKIYFISGVIDKEDVSTHLIGDIWIPIAPFLQGERSWYSASFYTYYKLKKSSDISTFEGELEDIRRNEIYADFGKSSGLTYEQWIQKPDAYRFIVRPLKDIHLKSMLNFEMSAGGNLQKIKGFLVIGILILLVAIANYINLSTARSYIRIKEIGVRKSLGGHRANLIRQFITESLVESIFVAAGAMILMYLVLGAFEQWAGSAFISDHFFSVGQIIYFLFFSLTIGLAAALYPALYLSAIRPVQLLITSDPPGNLGLRSVLVIFQFVITTWLICGSMVVYSQLKYMNNKDLGFDKKGLMVIDNIQALGNSRETFRDELAGNPLVISSAFAHSIPGATSIYQSSFKTPEMENSVALRVLPVDSDFLPTMGIKLVEGNNFTKRSTKDSTIAIINESAKKALGLTDPIGAQISEGVRVVGVVNDFHIESLKKGIQPIVLEHDPGGNLLNLRLKPDGDSGALSDFIEDAVYLWNRLHPESTFQYTFIDETFEKFAEQEQMESRGILALTAIAVLIACLGLFGLTTFTIKKREKEIGIRKILGASVAGIVNLLSKEFLWMMVLALLIAIPTAWYFIDQWLQNFAYRTDKIWWIFVSASIMSLFIAFITISFQGIKAALLNPVETLRNE